MSKKPNEPDQLRAKAEMQLARAPEKDGTPRPAEELLHELQVYQVELEMQNEELRQAQVELEKSRDRYVDLYDFAPVGYLTLTREAMIAEVNFTGAALLGIERKKLLQRRFAHLVSAEDNDCWNRFFVSILQHDERKSCELVLKRGNGSVFYAHMDCLHMKSASGGNSVRIAFTDISERKQIEEEQKLLDQRLRDQQFYTRSLIESNIDALMATDPSGIITDVNKQMEALTGCTRDELIGAPFKNYFTDPDLAEAGIKLVLSEKKVTDYELTARARDGKETVVSYNATTFYDRDRVLQGVLAAARDITERKQTEMALRDSNRLLEFSMQLSHMGSWDFNLVDHTATRTLEHDRIFGYESLLPHWNYDMFLEHVLPEDRLEVDCLFYGAIAAQKDLNFQCRIRRIDGAVRWILVAGEHQRDDKNAIWRMSGIVQDITERNCQDQVLQEKNIELESARSVADKANLAKSDFLSSMSHELRSPLNAILGFAQLMESDSPPATPSQKKSLAYILQAGWHLLTLINEILDLATVESGKVPMSQEPVAIDKVMLECQSMIENQAEQRGIKLAFPKFDIPLYVCADRTRLKQVLINLLSNAIKYNTKQGKVEVNCVENTPGRIRISIEDSGAGLHPEQMAQLFQPFNRLGQDAGSEEGTGIGLVLSKQLVELMGGTIGVRSTVGVGSVFWFELNSVAEPRLSMEGAETTALLQLSVLSGAQPHSLLYVEDNPANMQLVEAIISRYPGIQLLTAVNGYDGIEIARTSQPNVIMMDINLPDLSGLEALKILREDPATAHIPVIAISANALPLDIERGLKAGLFLYITKPIKVKEFMEAVNMALEFAEKKIDQKK
ncbi:MAG: PAS domain S-box protein [Candidatus Nitrotoga sp.]|nr:PAS domain S-box protein [Candidatus Nitrotoga sp.]